MQKPTTEQEQESEELEVYKELIERTKHWDLPARLRLAGAYLNHSVYRLTDYEEGLDLLGEFGGLIIQCHKDTYERFGTLEERH